jgi:hypothetical protein
MRRTIARAPSLWGQLLRALFRAAPAHPITSVSRGTTLREFQRSLWGVWILVALAGIAGAVVSGFQARYQAAIERGVTGSFRVTSCGHTRTTRGTELSSWTCTGYFRPPSGGEAFASLQTDQTEPPRGTVTVMAARASFTAVWLPGDVSAGRRWMKAVYCLVLLTLPACVLFVFSVRPRR